VKIRLVVVGRPRTAGLADAIAGFERRAARYWPLEVREVREASGRARTPDQVRDDEWKRLAQAAEGHRLVVLDRAGTSLTSEQFSAWLDGRRREAADLAFVIGGAYGLPQGARSGADHVLSMAPWTLSHELARLVLAEQLYRAGTILRGEPYHK
jgi:23S rRNA (pseudouridine1915-N3)-methyltransferase